jgi:hypothetical protein
MTSKEGELTREQIEEAIGDIRMGRPLGIKRAITLAEMALRAHPPAALTQEGGESIESYETDEWACAAGVLRFSAAMRAKLDRKRKVGRAGWNRPDECGIYTLKELLREHVEKGDPVDIANLCMMIWNRENPNASAPSPTPETPAGYVMGLPYVVEYRGKELDVAPQPWAVMAAFDAEGAASRYAAQCAGVNLPWEYRVRELSASPTPDRQKDGIREGELRPVEIDQLIEWHNRVGAAADQSDDLGGASWHRRRAEYWRRQK